MDSLEEIITSISPVFQEKKPAVIKEKPQNHLIS